MAIPYIVRKKKDSINEEKKELWYAVAKPMQQRGGMTKEDIIRRVSQHTGFSPGVVNGVLMEVIEAMEFFLAAGCTVNIKDLGSFQTALTSEGYEDPREITPAKAKLSRLYFVADRKLTRRIREAGTFKIPFRDYLPPQFWEKEDEEME